MHKVGTAIILRMNKKKKKFEKIFFTNNLYKDEKEKIQIYGKNYQKILKE